jgi:hypothetical protein
MDGPGDESLGISDRELLRWACREAQPCVVALPGRESWGRSFLVDLREGGPRPQLAIAQPSDLQRSERSRSLRSGESVRIWSVRDREPWHLDGFVSGLRVMETRDSGPVEAALVQLPYRLLDTDRQFSPHSSMGAPRAVVFVQSVGPQGRGAPAALVETWLDGEGEWVSRGGGYIVELSRRSFSFSVPIDSELVMLPGADAVFEFRLPDLRLLTRVEGAVVAVMDLGGHVFHGVSLGRPDDVISDEEHRETLRLVAGMCG